MSSDVDTYLVCSIGIAALAESEAAEAILAAGRAKRTLQVHLCNAYTLSLVDGDPELRAALERSDLNLPDGAPVAWLGWGHGVRTPVRGPGLLEDVLRLGGPAAHYLYGAGPGVAARMAARLQRTYPEARFVGVESPAFGRASDLELDELAESVRGSGAQILWVGLGTPGQDYVVPRLASRLEMPIVPVGAAFDFFAGTVSQAPQWMRGTGLEWLYRFWREPRRLWRRYVLGNPRFVRNVVVHWLRAWRKNR